MSVTTDEETTVIRVDKVTTASGTALNVLSVRDEFLHTINPKKIPNLMKITAVRQDHKWRVINIKLDSYSDIFDAFIEDDADNPVLTSLEVEMTVQKGTEEKTEKWVYAASKSYISDIPEARVEDERERNPFEYEITAYGTKVITWPA